MKGQQANLRMPILSEGSHASSLNGLVASSTRGLCGWKSCRKVVLFFVVCCLERKERGKREKRQTLLVARRAVELGVKLLAV